MSVSIRVLRRVALAIAVAIAATACNSNEKPNPGPTGRPADVVRAAPDITFRTGRARVLGAAPGVTATGTVIFDTGEDRFEVAGRKKDKPPFGVVQPAAVIDLLRGVVEVDPYGGAEVQGVGTKRYDVYIELSKAIAATPEPRRDDLRRLEGLLGRDNKIWADVFVDGAGRVRRVLLPVRTDSERPYGDDKHIPQMVSVDYSDFGGGE